MYAQSTAVDHRWPRVCDVLISILCATLSVLWGFVVLIVMAKLNHKGTENTEGCTEKNRTPFCSAL